MISIMFDAVAEHFQVKIPVELGQNLCALSSPPVVLTELVNAGLEQSPGGHRDPPWIGYSWRSNSLPLPPP